MPLVVNNYTIITPNRPICHHLFTGLLRLALLGLVLLSCWGIIPEGYAGWLTNPPILYGNPPRSKKRRSGPTFSWRHFHWRAAWKYAGSRLTRAEYQMGPLLMVSAPLSLGEWGWVILLPVVRWGVAVSAVAWPWWGQSALCRSLRRLLYRCYQLSVLMLGGASLCQLGGQFLEQSSLLGPGMAPLVLGGVVKREAKGWQFLIEEAGDGVMEITLTGPNGDCWFIRYRPVDEFDRRMFINFLRHIWTPEDTPKRPFLRQEWLAAGFETHQELISRWQRYCREADWRRMMSKRHTELLTYDQIGEIVDVWAPNFWWSAKEVQEHLASAEGSGEEYSLSQVREAGRLSGFLRVRRRLRERFKILEFG